LLSTRRSLPLFASLVDVAETAVWFGSTEVCQRLGLTARQLQWWDEQGLLPARHEGHKRLYSGRDAVLAGVIGILRKAGLGQARVRAALQTLTARGHTDRAAPLSRRQLALGTERWRTERGAGARAGRHVERARRVGAADRPGTDGKQALDGQILVLKGVGA
jgi:DNA-binding transcriptional MerR regulator